VKKKLTVVLVGILCLALTLVGCSSESKPEQSQEQSQEEEGKQEQVKDAIVTEPGAFPIVEDKVTLSVLATTDGIGVTDPETNWFLNHYEEKTNVQIDMELITGSKEQVDQRVNLKLVSGDYPDVFLGCNLNKEMQVVYGSRGILVPLNDLIDQYGYHIKKVFEEKPHVKQQLTTPDGNIYGLGSVNEFYHGSMPNKMWVYKPWLEKLNIDIPETTDEFYQMLKAFKEQDPNGNGKADEIPLAAGTINKGKEIYTYLMNSFIYYDDHNLNGAGYAPFNFTMLDGDKVEFIADKPEFKEGLAYLQKLYTEGLIAQEVYTMDRQQVQTIGMSEPPILGAGAALFPGEFTVGREEGARAYDYISIPPLKGPNGVQQTPELTFAVVGDKFSISNKSEHPEVAIRWIDWLYSFEGFATAHYGPELEGPSEEQAGWYRAESGQVGADGQQAMWTRNMLPAGAEGAENVSFGLRTAPVYQPIEYHTSMIVDVEANYAATNDLILYEQTKEKYEPYKVNKSIPRLYMSEENIAEFAEIEPILKDAVYEWMARFVTGNASLEKDWDNYISDLDRYGLDRLMELLQSEYDRNTTN
jgi:putative aldouronate transport system substrate-binding protein